MTPMRLKLCSSLFVRYLKGIEKSHFAHCMKKVTFPLHDGWRRFHISAYFRKTKILYFVCPNNLNSDSLPKHEYLLFSCIRKEDFSVHENMGKNDLFVSKIKERTTILLNIKRIFINFTKSLNFRFPKIKKYDIFVCLF